MDHSLTFTSLTHNLGTERALRQRLREAWVQNVQDQALLEALTQNVQDQALLEAYAQNVQDQALLEALAQNVQDQALKSLLLYKNCYFVWYISANNPN